MNSKKNSCRGNYMRKYGKLFTVLGGKLKFPAQDSDLEYLFWRSKNPPVFSELKPPLVVKLAN